MKKISPEWYGRLRGYYFENDDSIPISTLEKDVLVTEAIAAMASIQSDDFDLVFCGGTCMSKAHGLVERMSEDVDFKVMQKAGAAAFSNTQLRSRLSDLKASIKTALLDRGFVVDDTNIRARDSNKYIAIDVPYDTSFGASEILRPHLQLEVNFTPAQRKTLTKPVGYLVDRLIGDESEVCAMACVDVSETVAEKLVSFPRRYAMYLRGYNRGEFDKTLVRHLFDVHETIRQSPDIVSGNAFAQMVAKVMQKDGQDFKNQHPEFDADPFGECLHAMAMAGDSEEIQGHYAMFVEEMVYGDNPPSFESAIAVFRKALVDVALSTQKDQQHGVDRESELPAPAC